MSDLIHIIRDRPIWSTTNGILACGNRPTASALTASEFEDYVKNECRNSRQVAYGTCCVTCVNHYKDPFNYRHIRNADKDAPKALLLEYLNRSSREELYNERVRAEVRAIDELIEAHGDQFVSIVERIMLRATQPSLQAVRNVNESQ